MHRVRVYNIALFIVPNIAMYMCSTLLYSVPYIEVYIVPNIAVHICSTLLFTLFSKFQCNVAMQQ